MIKATKKDTGNLIYMRLKKHNCPLCGKELKVVKMTKVVKAKTKEAASFNFKACDLPLGEKVKFVWYEFKCRDCGKQFTEQDMKNHDKRVKREAAEAKKAAKKEAKKAARAEAKAAKEAESDT